jgi:ribosomal protein S18 acetylase RimI-like enzyme
MQPTQLRPAEDADREFLIGLVASARADELAMAATDPLALATLLQLQFEAQQQHYRRQFADAEHAIIVGPQGPLGRWYVHRAADEIRLVDICLLPAHRRQGIGEALLRGLLAEGARAGLPVRLSVRPGNPAIRLYQRLGFAVVGTNETHSALEWRAHQTIII